MVSPQIKEISQTVSLRNDFVRIQVLPESGGKVWSLRKTNGGRQWIWQNPNVPPASHPLGTIYDDNWAGGWEELFPTDSACEWEGKSLPDHGEWWSQKWNWEKIDDSSIRLWYEGKHVKTYCEKWITLNSSKSEVSIRYRIESKEKTPFHFLFKQHLPVAVKSGDRLELPGGKGTPVDLNFSSIIKSPDMFDWPMGTGLGGKKVDLSLIPPPESKLKEFLYMLDLPEGLCGVSDPLTGESIRIQYSVADFPYTWLFMTWGGWRGLYTVVLEPCTNFPKELKEAAKRNQSGFLGPNEVFETTVKVEL